MPAPPAAEQALGLGAYLTSQPGIGGKLRTESEDFQVIELGPGPKPAPEGRFAAARIRLRNWETNRFVGKAATRLRLKRQQVGFAGMKDKRAVTEQWFTFQMRGDDLKQLEELQDVQILETRRTATRQFAGAHDGNRFVLRIRDHTAQPGQVEAIIERIRDEGGVPHYFGPQRFGSGVRPTTHLMGKALVQGDLEEAVRLYCGHPMEGERDDTFHARMIYESTRDPQETLDFLPHQLDLEHGILERLVRRPGDWAYALRAMPDNLLTLFIHSWQSFIFNHILTARMESGLGLRTAHLGDRVMAFEDDGLRTHLVTAANQARVQAEIDAGRASPTIILPGMDVPMAEGEAGEIERRVLAQYGVHPRDFRAYAMPHLASAGRRRCALQRVEDLSLEFVGGDPVIGFSLGRGSYATVVMREVMKAELEDY